MTRRPRCDSCLAGVIALACVLLARDAASEPRHPEAREAADAARAPPKGPAPDLESGAAARSVTVAGDRSAEVRFGPKKSKLAILYLHGVCGDPLAFSSWVRAATRHGTLISLRGDTRCEDKPDRTKWGYDFAATDRRIRKAIAAVSKARRGRGEAELTDEDVALIGYSQGARRVEWLAGRFPKRYRRVALIGIAVEPSPERLGGTDGVLLMAGELDARHHIKLGRDALVTAKKRVHYLELPQARHGEYGPDALAVMGKGLDWLLAPR
ncbi:MAG: hypothetical protein EXR75_06075 [Myxococcales bacterium]|nr:hypothetical protein [Myxococcales bacterium]